MYVIAENEATDIIAPGPHATPKKQDANSVCWRQLAYLNVYRLLLATGCIVLAYQHVTFLHQDGNGNPLFLTTSLIYLVVGLIYVPTIRWHLLDPIQLTQAGILIDIIIITLLMHASGGVRSGLGMLLVISIAAGSAIVGGQMARLFAAIATFAVLAEQSILGLHHPIEALNYAHAGLLGASFFATAILAHHLARRLRESEALADRRGIDLANMAQLTDYIIQRMQTGVIVIDEHQGIRLINESARQLLGIPANTRLHELAQLPDKLCQQLADWRTHQETRQAFRSTTMSAEVMPRFARLGRQQRSGALIFLEDTAATVQQAQQLKLAALGRLTASIAHEIRNPLAAISHASQLLDESHQIREGDHRLLEIIQNHTQRVNNIIKNIMQLSRREQNHPQHFEFRQWLQSYAIELVHDLGLKEGQITIGPHDEDLMIRVDPDQLRMILDNLCHNSILHGNHRDTTHLTLNCGISAESRRPFLDIIDNGPGIPEQIIDHIFEPFFTTAQHGTGLGLYLSRELAECNQVHLTCLPKQAQEQGCRFRMTFADPRRKQIP